MSSSALHSAKCEARRNRSSDLRKQFPVKNRTPKHQKGKHWDVTFGGHRNINRQVIVTWFSTRISHQSRGPFHDPNAVAVNEHNNLQRFVVCESIFSRVYFFRRYQLLVPNLRISLLGSHRKTHDILFLQHNLQPFKERKPFFFTESH
jgi:hypothetical protein